MDEDGFIQEVKVTKGNVHDSQVLEEILTGSEEALYGDLSYSSASTQEMCDTKKIENKINKRRYRNKTLTKEEAVYNQRRAQHLLRCREDVWSFKTSLWDGKNKIFRNI